MNLTISDRFDVRPCSKEEAASVTAQVEAQVKTALDKCQVDQSLYSVGLPDAADDGRWCLHFESDLWVVYLAERGMRKGGAFFTNAWDAASFMVWTLTAPPKAGGLGAPRLPVGLWG
jgi:hypothetical protein